MVRARSDKTVETRRRARYADKLHHIEERLAWYAEWSPGSGKDPLRRLASYKALQEAAEAFADVAAMVVADSARGVKDDATNLRLAAEAGAFSAVHAAALVEPNGLRNVLVHEYEGIDHERAVASAGRLVPALRAAIEEVRGWISRS